MVSHPSWVCGLKLSLLSLRILVLCHTLRGCVDWNIYPGGFRLCIDVTPFVGVWIETSAKNNGSNVTGSHPSWVCGLKQRANMAYLENVKVTPFVGVWIETLNLIGLKEQIRVTPFVGVWIETFHTDISLLQRIVTPFVGVWIETPVLTSAAKSNGVTPFVGVWIETNSDRKLELSIIVTPFVGVWIETSYLV